MIRVVVVGPESTGKTTLAQALATHLRVPWVPEYARQFVDASGVPPQASDVEAIARGQIELEDEAIAGAPELLVLDTDLVSTVVYSRHYFEACPAWIESEARRRLGDLYLLAWLDVPWEPDGAQRVLPSARAELHRAFDDTLHSLGAIVHEVAGTPEARLLSAVMAIERIRRR